MFVPLTLVSAILLPLAASRPAVIPQSASSSVTAGTYSRCRKGHGTGYAHYDGWRLVGDDLSGAVPVSPESACINACNKYGAACSGVFFDASISRCYLKAVHPAIWSFERGEEGDGTDLVGGCELWAGLVPQDMDSICCID